MSAKLLTAPEKMGKTFGISIRILGGVAVAQVVVVLWALLMRFDGEARASIPSAVSIPIITERPLVGPQPSPPVSPLPVVPPSSFPNTVYTPPITIPPDTRPLAEPQRDARHHLASPDAQAAVRKALGLREKGDTQGALESLKEADAKEPDHPKILAELATTYGQMGLRKRETEHWTKIHEMGIVRAGAYWDLADMFFRGQESAPEVDTALRVKGHIAVQDDDATDGQRVNLEIHIEAIQQDPIDAKDLVLQVYFYDRANGTTYQPTIADVITHADVTVPYDWKFGTERIDVEYFLPTLTDEETALNGSREYYGYVVELYYQNVLQDFVANPRKLGRLGGSGGQPEASGLPPSKLFPNAPSE